MPQEIDHIAQLQKRLYSRDPDSIPKRTYGILRPEKQKIENAWGKTELDADKGKRKINMRGFKRFFIVSLVFFCLAALAATFSVYRGAITLSSKNVDVNILGNSFTGGGEELPLEIEIANRNAADMLEAVLVIEYPRGAIDTQGSDVVRVERIVGTIGSGKTHSEAVTAILYGEQGTTRAINATLNYKLAGASSVFQKVQNFAVTISSSPIALIVDGPAAIASNQPFSLTLRARFDGDNLPERTVVRVEYPGGFVFRSANPAPIAGNNVWAIGDLERGVERTITLSGKVLGEETDQKSFRVYIGTPENQTENRIGVTYNSTLHTLVLSRPFINGSIAIGGGDDVAAIPIGDSVSGTVEWTNTSDVSITNPVFVLSIGGAGVNGSSVSAGDGIYDAIAGTISWSGERIPGLSLLEPGQVGSLPFSFSPKEGQSGDITLSLLVRGTPADLVSGEQSIAGLDSMSVRFASRLQFAAASVYSTGPIKNTGPFPPKVNTPTTYTLTWTMRPSEHALSGASATAILPEGVVWTGTVSPQSEQISYNPDTRTVLWNIGSMPRATGAALSRNVSFQVSVQPVVSQLGQELQLLGVTTVSATDSVANVPLTTTRPALTTQLDSDPTYSLGEEKVLP